MSAYDYSKDSGIKVLVDTVLGNFSGIPDHAEDPIKKVTKNGSIGIVFSSTSTAGDTLLIGGVVTVIDERIGIRCFTDTERDLILRNKTVFLKTSDERSKFDDSHECSTSVFVFVVE